MNDELIFDADGPVLLVGGYGTVGAELARMAAPSWPLVLTGRTVQRGQRLADETGAELRTWDLADPAPFRAEISAVVTVVNDPDDRVLRAAISGGVPFVDVTRWTTRLQRAATVAAMSGPTAPVLLSSAWMGGVTSLVAACLGDRLGGADTVDVAIRWDLADRAGSDSVEFMDRLGLDYEVMRDGQRHTVMPLSDAGRIRIGETLTRVARIDTPEQFTLPSPSPRRPQPPGSASARPRPRRPCWPPSGSGSSAGAAASASPVHAADCCTHPAREAQPSSASTSPAGAIPSPRP